MITYKGPICDATIKIKPSEDLYRYITKIKSTSKDIPSGIRYILTRKNEKSSSKVDIQKYLLTSHDYEEIQSLGDHFDLKSSSSITKPDKVKVVDKILQVQDLRWLYEYIKEQNEENAVKVYLHELIEGSEVLLPENTKVPRNPELEKRCQLLRIQQENARYQSMTKNVDNVRKRLPEDTIGYQIKEMNKQLIAVFQFIISVFAGFAFGFIGMEVFVGTLDFGFRLLLGIICGLIVALAELYFLAKKLNEDYGEPQIFEEKAKVD